MYRISILQRVPFRIINAPTKIVEQETSAIIHPRPGGAAIGINASANASPEATVKVAFGEN